MAVREFREGSEVEDKRSEAERRKGEEMGRERRNKEKKRFFFFKLKSSVNITI